MGAVGALVLAAINRKDFSTTGQKILIIGVIALGIGAMIGVFFSQGLAFKLTFVVAYFAVIWGMPRSRAHSRRAQLVNQGNATTMRLTTMVVFILIGSTCCLASCSRASAARSGSSTC